MQAEIAVYRGSCLVLASDIREASADVDAVFGARSRTALYEIVDEVSREMSLPKDWMNEAVRRSAHPPNEPQPPRIPFGDYPRDTAKGCGLRVFLPTPEYMLAMKLLAQRGGGPNEDEKADGSPGQLGADARDRHRHEGQAPEAHGGLLPSHHGHAVTAARPKARH